jgi:glycosyltransferase involved in cell wall biosynthesis
MTGTPTKRHPLVTFALVAYNQENFIREAVEGAFSQTYEPLEIILSDDASGDRTFELIQNMVTNYNGPHHILINRNTRNLGVAEHINAVLKLSCGDIIVMAAGDDVSLPHRVSSSVRYLTSDADIQTISFRDIVVDEHGKPFPRISNEKPNNRSITLREFLTTNTHLSGASRAFRKSVYTTFGPLNAECPTEDTPFLLRSLLLGRGFMSAEAGIFYRQHTMNLSSAISQKQMAFHAIESQYKKDINCAKELGLVTSADARLLEKWIHLQRARRTLRVNLSNQTCYWSLHSLRAIFSGHFSVREKIGILARMLKLL